MRALVVLAAVALAAVGVERTTSAPGLKAVSAPAEAVAAGSGTVLGAIEFDGPARLLRLRPLTLEAVSPPLRLTETFLHDFAVSPDGRRLAVGSESHNRIELVDLRRWRSLGTIALPGPRPSGYGGASGLAWTSPRRLIALSGAPYMNASPLVLDPVSRRVVHRAGWRGPPLHWETHGERLLVLAAPSRPPLPGPARLMSFDARGQLREMRLARIPAGAGEAGPGPARDLMPALAVDQSGERAYVVAAEGGLVAEVDLRSWELSYHRLSDAATAWRRLLDLLEPPAHAKGEPVESFWRDAEVLPNGAIALAGEDYPATDDPHERRPVPFGIRLIDPRSWTMRTVDSDAQGFDVAGGLLLARRWSVPGDGLEGIGVRAYDTAGKQVFARFVGANAIVRGAAGRHAYVEVRQHGRRRIHVLDLESGRTLRTAPARELRVLDR